MEYKILEKINFPSDLKGLSQTELNTLSKEIRSLLIKKISETGGHFGPNLGVLEMTIALHYVFNSPKDKIVFDVSHQCYTHKILTGRKEAFIDPKKYNTITGYTNQNESKHDFFTVGHTSTSISLALGLAKARDIKGDNENIIAIIGDGSLSGGMAYEALNNAATSGKNIIIIINDNEMSIAANQGGLYKNLSLLRSTKGSGNNNFFKTLGFDYFYVKNGNNLKSLVEVFNKVKDMDHPIIVHINTKKGKGYEEAEKDKERFHWVSPFDLESKELKSLNTEESYTKMAGDYILEKAKKDNSIIAITPATPYAGQLYEFREELPNQYIDVGIAEAHAVTFGAAIACGGGKPIINLASSFIQRTYDQLSQDIAINKSPALIMVYDGGISGGDVGHLGTFDIPLISNIPNIKYLAPTSKEELIAMIDYGIEQSKVPVAIRVPNGKVIECDYNISQTNFEDDKFIKIKEGSEICIIAVGTFFNLGKEIHEGILNTLNMNATLINPRVISSIDKEMLDDISNNHSVVVTLEDGILNGGFGEKVSSYLGNKDIKVLNFGADKEFTDSIPIKDLYNKYHLTKELIIKDIIKIL
ncbi:MAG: 1-deoxy-D-xylulose-5-phosphate synthase [Clostridium sp.]